MERREKEEGKGEREKRVGLWTTVTKEIPSLVQGIKAWVPPITNALKAMTNPWVVGVAAVVTVGSMTASAISFGCIAKAQMDRAESEEKRANAKAKKRAAAERMLAEAAEERAREAAVTPVGGGGRRRLSWP